MSAENKLLAARTVLILDAPFFGSLAVQLPLVADKKVRTAATNGAIIKYNPAYIDSLEHERIVALLEHEVMHVAGGDPWRRDGREMKDWNIACDKKINHELRETGLQLPNGVYYAEGAEIGMSAEWIYGRMQEARAKQQQEKQDQQQQQSQGDNSEGDDEGDEDGDADGDGEGEGEDDQTDDEQEGGDQTGDGDEQDDQEGDSDASGGGDGQEDGDEGTEGQQDAQEGSQGDAEDEGEPDPLGEVEDAPTEADADGNKPPTEQEWKERVVVAMTQAKLMGKMPAGLERQIEASLQPRKDIRSLLLRFFSERSNSDYSWSRPNPRYVSQGLYLPALQAHELGEIAIYVDTSASMDRTAMQFARGVIEEVIDECSPTAVTVWYADADVARVDRFEKGAPLEWRPAGFGGTDFRPALAGIEKEGTAVCAVCITDLEGTFPDVPPSFPVLWLVPKTPWTREEVTAPFGETIHFDK